MSTGKMLWGDLIALLSGAAILVSFFIPTIGWFFIKASFYSLAKAGGQLKYLYVYPGIGVLLMLFALLLHSCKAHPWFRVIYLAPALLIIIGIIGSGRSIPTFQLLMLVEQGGAAVLLMLGGFAGSVAAALAAGIFYRATLTASRNIDIVPHQYPNQTGGVFVMRGTSNAPLILGIVGSVLMIPGLGCSVCAGGLASVGSGNDTSFIVGLIFGLLPIILGIYGASAGKSKPVTSCIVLLIASVMAAIGWFITLFTSMFHLIALILFLIGAIIAKVQKMEDM